MKAQISLSPSPANCCTSDFPGKGTLPVLRSLAANGLGAQGGSERGCHISSERQEVEKSRGGSGAPLGSPPLAKPSELCSSRSWHGRKPSNFHPGDTERQRGAKSWKSKGCDPRGLLEIPPFCSLSEAELILPHFALWLMARLL